MKITYDRVADALYVLLRDDAEVAETLIITDTVNLDVDAEGRVIGFEMLDASAVMGDEPLRALSVETYTEPAEVVVLPTQEAV